MKKINRRLSGGNEYKENSASTGGARSLPKRWKLFESARCIEINGVMVRLTDHQFKVIREVTNSYLRGEPGMNHEDIYRNCFKRDRPRYDFNRPTWTARKPFDAGKNKEKTKRNMRLFRELCLVRGDLVSLNPFAKLNPKDFSEFPSVERKVAG